jgi:hypothetical protein
MLTIYLLMRSIRHEGSSIVKAVTDWKPLVPEMRARMERENADVLPTRETQIAEAFRDLKPWSVEADMWDGDEVEMAKIRKDWDNDYIMREEDDTASEVIGRLVWKRADKTYWIRKLRVEGLKSTPIPGLNGPSAERYSDDGDGVGGLAPGLV